MNFKRIIIGAVALSLISISTCQVKAAELSDTPNKLADLKMSVSAPKDWDVMTPDLADDAPVFAKYGLDAEKLKSVREGWKTGNVLIDTMSSDLKYEITITKSNWENTNEITHLSQLKDADLDSTKETMLKGMAEKNYTVNTSEVKKVGDITYFTLDGKIMVNGSFRNVYQYITIVNSNMITFNLMSSQNIEDANKDVLDSVIKSVKFDQLDEAKDLYGFGQPMEPLWRKALYRIIIGVVAMALVVGVVTFVKKKKKKQ